MATFGMNTLQCLRSNCNKNWNSWHLNALIATSAINYPILKRLQGSTHQEETVTMRKVDYSPPTREPETCQLNISADAYSISNGF